MGVMVYRGLGGEPESRGCLGRSSGRLLANRRGTAACLLLGRPARGCELILVALYVTPRWPGAPNYDTID